MAKKSFIERELDRARALLANDPEFGDVLKQVSRVRKDAEAAKSPSEPERLRVPYVDAIPLNTGSWD
jgi:hypothetical protein